MLRKSLMAFAVASGASSSAALAADSIVPPVVSQLEGRLGLLKALESQRNRVQGYWQRRERIVAASDPVADVRADAKAGPVGPMVVSSGYAPIYTAPGLKCSGDLMRGAIYHVEFGDALTADQRSFLEVFARYAEAYNRYLYAQGALASLHCSPTETIPGR
ncbi:hypothetical protein [Methyloceanibacter sp.]|uniref:hypothetical protein n=1 Tax=Methyloceanibacter sp. TaxID=1965321 RepID=UPI002D26EE5E|nr:hypothetical protein [Methyloceanibacter sp.]HZP08399.1 hypothetical protein [Methyloceanibacter sp.]